MTAGRGSAIIWEDVTWPSDQRSVCVSKRLFSGIQPSGDIHIGNYLGAIRNWVELLDQFECIYCVVDYHAITVPYEPAEMRTRILNAAAVNIACGIDPDRCTLFVQSHVPEHTELTWLLNTVTPIGDLQRMTQFKDKSRQHEANICAGLLNYPVLMAADILLYKAEVVPVGDDQVQHLELTREICRRFNARYGEVFPEPKPKLSTTPRIRGLDGKAKMSKSRGNTISLFDEPALIEKKLKGAFTDEQKLRRGDPGRPEVCNVFTMHLAVVAADETVAIERDCRSGALGCGDCKKRLSQVLIDEFAPIQARAADLRANRGEVLDALRAGAARARELAEATMTEVRDAMGMTTRALD